MFALCLCGFFPGILGSALTVQNMHIRLTVTVCEPYYKPVIPPYVPSGIAAKSQHLSYKTMRLVLQAAGLKLALIP